MAHQDYIRPFVQLDRFAAARDLLSYPICSLYLDSSDLGCVARPSMDTRIATSCGCEPTPTTGRSTLLRGEAEGGRHSAQSPVADQPCAGGRDSLRQDRPRVDQFTPDLIARINEFSALTETAHAKPVLRVRSISGRRTSRLGPDQVRITFDTHLRHAVTPVFEVSHDGPGWCATPVPGTILEIKFTQSFPSWVATSHPDFRSAEAFSGEVLPVDDLCTQRRPLSRPDGGSPSQPLVESDVMGEFVQILNSSNRWFPDYSLEALVLSLLCAFVLAQAVAWVYTWTHTGLSYSRTFTQSLLLMSIVVTLVMYVIGNSIVTAFGLLGAMAIIRFRNVLKDTRDTVFIFFILLLGMATGTQRYGMAFVGTAAFVLVALYLFYTSFGTLGRFDGHLSLQLAKGGDDSELDRTLHRFCRSVKRLSLRQTGADDVAEYLFQIRFRDRRRRQEMMETLQSLGAVSNLSLVLTDEMSEV